MGNEDAKSQYFTFCGSVVLPVSIALDIDHNKHVIGAYGCYKVISQLIYV